MLNNQNFSCLLSKLLCKLGRHDWHTELRGQSFQGSVYPVRFRTCNRCKTIEQEVYDEEHETSSWVEPNK